MLFKHFLTVTDSKDSQSSTMDTKLFLKTPPPLDPVWLAYEKEADLLNKPKVADILARQKIYAQTCRERNAALLSGRDHHLTRDIKVLDTGITANDNYHIPIRSYNPASIPGGPPLYLAGEGEAKSEPRPIVIYYHGGGLTLGDLDSEDLTCRRICKAFDCTVYSVEYRLMLEYTADRAIKDAKQAFQEITTHREASRFIVVGSSSGGQLAAQISQFFGRGLTKSKVHGVLLRCPVTCDATDGGVNVPEAWREHHKSMSPAFYTSILSSAALDSLNRPKTFSLPLEAKDFSGLPRTFIQVTTNDIYYSDGICYAAVLEDAGVEIRLDVVEGWPHTFWLKAPLLDRAVKAEEDMIEGLRWLLEAEIEEEAEKSA